MLCRLPPLLHACAGGDRRGQSGRGCLKGLIEQRRQTPAQTHSGKHRHGGTGTEIDTDTGTQALHTHTHTLHTHTHSCRHRHRPGPRRGKERRSAAAGVRCPTAIMPPTPAPPLSVRPPYHSLPPTLSLPPRLRLPAFPPSPSPPSPSLSPFRDLQRQPLQSECRAGRGSGFKIEVLGCIRFGLRVLDRIWIRFGLMA